MTKKLPKRISVTIERERHSDLLLASFDETGAELCADGETTRVGIYQLVEERVVELKPVVRNIRKIKFHD